MSARGALKRAVKSVPSTQPTAPMAPATHADAQPALLSVAEGVGVLEGVAEDVAEGVVEGEEPGEALRVGVGVGLWLGHTTLRIMLLFESAMYVAIGVVNTPSGELSIAEKGLPST